KLTSTTNGMAINAHSGLADANRHALAFLTASTYAAIEAHVIANQTDLSHALWPIADEGCALDGVVDLAVFHPVRLAGRKHKLATGDIHLTTAEVGGVQALFDGGNDFLRIFVTTQHVSVGHARHGQAGVAFAAAIACWLYTHQTRIERVLDIAF